MGGVIFALFWFYFTINLIMLLAKERDCFKIFVCAGLVFVLSNWQSVASKGFSAVKIENITTLESVRDGCCYYNVTMKWQVVPFNRSHLPLFKIWLTIDDEGIRNISMSDSPASNENWFQYTFIRLLPAKNYIAHIEGYISTENVTSYAKISFDVKRVTIYKDVLTPNVSAEDGYLTINWMIPKKHRRSSTPITYNISLCSNDAIPYACKDVFTMCKATYHYKDSTSSVGQVRLYDENWRKFVNKKSTVQRPLRKTWNSLDYHFSCSIYLHVCMNELSFRQILQYSIDYGDGTYEIQHDRVDFQKGFSYKPDFINVSFSMPKDSNRITAKVRWRLRITCRQDPAVYLRILLSGKKTRLEKDFHKFKFISSDSSKEYADGATKFEDLSPYSNYTIQFITEDDSKRITTTSKIFITPQGVPTSKPIIQPIVRGLNDCIENKRNVTVMWKLPVKDTNGLIRNITVKYFKKDSDPQFILLPNVKSTVIFGLDCNVEYRVQVRACIYVNESCSPYSDAQVIVKVRFADNGTQTTDGSNVPLWASLGVGLVVILVALVACQYIYRRKRRKPLEQITENVGHPYYDADKTDLSELGHYEKVDEEGYHNDTVG